MKTIKSILTWIYIVVIIIGSIVFIIWMTWLSWPIFTPTGWIIFIGLAVISLIALKFQKLDIDKEK